MNVKMMWISLSAATAVLAAGCSPSFWGGGATGAVGAGAGYEWHANQEKKKIDDDLKAGKIDQREYDIRRDQIQRDSVLQ